MSRKKKYNSVPAKRTPKQTQQGKIPPKTMAIISVCAIILGIMITAHDYLDRHTEAASTARTLTTEALAEVSSTLPDYIDACPDADSSVIGKMKASADGLSSADIEEQSEAYRTILSCFETLNESNASSAQDKAKALENALSAAEDAAVAYNKEANAVNEKVGKFPYNIVAKIAGYTECPIFRLN